MQLIKNQILDMISRMMEENKENEALLNQLRAIKKLISIF